MSRLASTSWAYFFPNKISMLQPSPFTDAHSLFVTKFLGQIIPQNKCGLQSMGGVLGLSDADTILQQFPIVFSSLPAVIGMMTEKIARLCGET
jgi:hypothetical protein